MNVPSEHKALLDFVEEEFYQSIEHMFNNRDELVLMGFNPSKTLSLMKKENLAKEVYVNTYALYFEDKELKQLADKVTQLNNIKKDLATLLENKQDLLEEKAFKTLEGWLTHNIEQITK